MRMQDLRRYREHLPGSGLRAQRRWVVAFIAAVALLSGIMAAVAARAADEERIGQYWTHAAVLDADEAQIIEVIDYDFGVERRHGILRRVPGVDLEAPHEVRSPTAPDDLEVTVDGTEVEFRVGDPAATVSGQHRYRIEYTVDELVRDSRFSWNAVGLDWSVSIGEVVVHVTAPYRFEELRCDQGRAGSRGGCTVSQIEPGHLLVETSELSAFEGVTVSATFGQTLGVPPAAPVEPTGPAPDPGSSWLRLGAAVSAIALLVGLLTWSGLRWLGRDRVRIHGAVPPSRWSPGDHGAAVRSLDQSRLARLAPTQYTAPTGLTAAQGGILYDEEVRDRHKAAWLVERAVDGEIDLSSPPLLLRTDALPSPEASPILDEMFQGRRRLRLGAYDSAFGEAWDHLGDELETWRQTSGFWDPRGRTRQRVASTAGPILATVAFIVAVVASAGASRWGSPWLAVALVAAAVTGAGTALFFGAWELRRRTPEGSSKWLQIESFRRSLASLDAHRADAAAHAGLLRGYTAWAVSLGQLDHWQSAVKEAARRPGADRGDYEHDLGFIGGTTHVTPSTAVATAVARRDWGFDRRSDSDGFGGSGGFGGFGDAGAGSGGGGGGGDSW